jgi:predicted anti-sigma-YlaC factor YlaD
MQITIDLKENFCEEMRNILKDQINTELIDTEVLKEHLDKCSFCKTHLKIMGTSLMKHFSFSDISKLIIG